MEITCPSGLRGVIRKVKVKEFSKLGNRRLLENGEAFDGLFEGCWVETLEYGPAYDPKTFSWRSSALQGDRFYALIAIRALTLGMMDVDPQCPLCPRGKLTPWRFDLMQLPTKPYPLESLEKHRRGERFEMVVAGRRVEHTLLTAADEKLMRQLASKLDDVDDLMPLTAAYRCRSVEGIEPGKDERERIFAWVKELDLDDLYVLLEGLQPHAGGVETTFGVLCKEHGEFQVELPITAPAFWKPKRVGA